jgi:16S rRNA (cytosine1402-N4)-methyltransferase
VAHLAVLSQESIQILEPRPGAVFVDCTLGAGGHARAIAERIRPGGRLLGLDRDPDAIERGREALARTGIEVLLRQANFGDLLTVAAGAGLDKADGILFDLGLSSHQLDEPSRGFSFRSAGPLDMRMDATSGRPAADLVNALPERELARLIRHLGEERWAARIAGFIVKRRPLRTTRDLASAVEGAIPRAAWPRDIHPATRTFQAIRMAVNDELDSLQRGLESAIQLLPPGGRMATISFHSLEDRTVKDFFNVESKDCVCPPQQPVCTCAHRATLRILTRRPIRPSPEEVAANPRSRSARLRAAERV